MARFNLSEALGFQHAPDSPLGGLGGGPEAKPQIKTIGSGVSPTEAIESRWKRPLHANGTGATHVRTFTGKMNSAGLEYMDKHINDWLDTHPQAEVKFATMSVGEFTTALGKEQTIIVQVWI